MLDFITTRPCVMEKIETVSLEIILTVTVSEIRVTAFNSGDTEAYAGHGAPLPGAKFRVYVVSAPARYKIKAFDMFVSDVSGQLSEASSSSVSNTTGSETEEEVASISTLEFKGSSDDVVGNPATSSFFGLIVEENNKTTMVIPDGPCAPQSVTSASCEVLARYLGWHIDKRSVSSIIPGHLPQSLAHKVPSDKSMRALEFL